MDKVRIGIVGLGNIGRFHASYLQEGKVRRGELAAVCSRRKQPLGSDKPLPVFPDIQSLIASKTVDAVVICTPHPQHLDEGTQALQASLHVMMEKPIAAHKADAERLIAVHAAHPKAVFAAMFQFRTEPRYQKMRELIQSGELGRIVRVNWINTDWFRSEAYYASSEWRATWKGEGGGVLINQCLHNLDTLQWLCGMPTRVRGFCQFGRYHQIEVEDNATAWLEWQSGASGVFIGSTGEAPGTNRLEIAGTLGRLVLEQDRLTLEQNEADMTEYCRTVKGGFGKPASHRTDVPAGNAPAQHVAMTQNFVNAILDGEPLIAPGAEGLHSKELANAIVFSSLLGKPIELPMDGTAWQVRLNELIANSTVKKNVVTGGSGDVAGSFRR